MAEARRKFIFGALAFGCGALIAAYGGQAPPPKGRPMAGVPVRTDLEGLRETFPNLGRMVSAHWQKRVFRAVSWIPGPSDVLIQALIVLQGSDLATASTRYFWGEPPVAGWEEQISGDLRPFAPSSAQWRHNPLYEVDVQAPSFGGGLVCADLRTGTIYLNVFTG